jgi:nicotinic acid phosphoribosyltransferase
MDPARSPLLTDLYQLNMIQTHLNRDKTKTAVFEFFVRNLPDARLDSGDLITLSKNVRHILADGGLADVTIFATGGIDEDALGAFAKEHAPIDGFGIGTSLGTSSDASALDCAYKLREHAGLPRRKRSTGRATWPGSKQVWRRYGPDGRMAGDIISVEDDVQPGPPYPNAGRQLPGANGRRRRRPPSATGVA